MDTLGQTLHNHYLIRFRIKKCRIQLQEWVCNDVAHPEYILPFKNLNYGKRGKFSRKSESVTGSHDVRRDDVRSYC